MKIVELIGKYFKFVFFISVKVKPLIQTRGPNLKLVQFIPKTNSTARFIYSFCLDAKILYTILQASDFSRRRIKRWYFNNIKNVFVYKLTKILIKLRKMNLNIRLHASSDISTPLTPPDTPSFGTTPPTVKGRDQ